MNPFAQHLQPPDWCFEGLLSNPPIYSINGAANRVIDLRTGRFASALIPSADAVKELANLPLSASRAMALIEQSPNLAKLAPMLQAMQLTSSVAAIASVATLGVVCVGFAMVLHRLNRIEGKLDEALSRLAALKEAVDKIATHQELLSIAQIRTACDLADSALHAETERRRTELASQARTLFLKSRKLYQEIWRRSEPALAPEIDIRTAMELQGRIVACAVGELQAEFIGGDLGAFVHAAKTVSEDVRQSITFDAVDALERRSDHAVSTEQFSPSIGTMTNQLIVVRKGVDVAVERIAGYAEDAEIVRALNIPPHEFLREVQRLPGSTIYTLPL